MRPHDAVCPRPSPHRSAGGLAQARWQSQAGGQGLRAACMNRLWRRRASASTSPRTSSWLSTARNPNLSPHFSRTDRTSGRRSGGKRPARPRPIKCPVRASNGHPAAPAFRHERAHRRSRPARPLWTRSRRLACPRPRFRKSRKGALSGRRALLSLAGGSGTHEARPVHGSRSKVRQVGTSVPCDGQTCVRTFPGS
jgi:hypothetical protein